MFGARHPPAPHGVAATPRTPAEADWAHGIPEMSSSGFGGPAVPRCLVLRDARSNPDRGLLIELYQPSVVDIRDECLRLRGIEAMLLGQGQQAAMVQEWLVRFYGP
jgi:hypothetical protein